MLTAIQTLFLASHFFTLSAAAQIAESPVSVPAGRAVLPIAAGLAGPQSVGAAAGTLSPLAPALMPVFSAPLHSEPASAAAAVPALAAARAAIPIASPSHSVPTDSSLATTGASATLGAHAALLGTGRAALEIERPEARIASSEDRVLRSVFGDRREAESLVHAAPLALSHAGLSAASYRVQLNPSEPAPAAAAPAKKDSPVLRLATGLGLIAVQAAMIHWGMRPFAIFMTAVSGLMMYEYDVMMSRGGHMVQRVIAVIAGVSLAYTVSIGLSTASLPILAGVMLFRELFEKERSYDRVALTLTGAFLLGWLPAHVSLIRETNPHGQAMTYMFFAAVWATDTFAYIVGKTLGRHKMAPVLSPKKTWEGAVGGFLAALATTFAFAHFMPDLFSWHTAAIIGAAIGVLGQLSGFSASMIKRWAGFKDSGKLLPGHGGFLDRFDSVLFSAPLVYWLLSMFH
jgi:phosphatidate cytidylyltransferase